MIFVAVLAWNDKPVLEGAPMYEPIGGLKFKGTCEIIVKFRNTSEYIKFCKYVLHTNWTVDSVVWSTSLKMDFECTDDIEWITKQIVYLLQLGFNVYSANWKLATETSAIIERKEEC